jgi:DNA polymerase V
VEPDADGARIAELDEQSYRETLWDHRPLTDFWRVGRGYAAKLEASGIRTMGDVARCSLGRNRDLLYKLFGVNAELLIDHAWGYEPCTIADIKGYRPESSSLCSGQVLQSPYTAAKARLVLREMTDLLVLDLADKGLVTDQMVLTVGYDIENITGGMYHGPVTRDPYGRLIPKHAHGSINLGGHTVSTKRILEAVTGLYDRIVDPNLLIRRLNITANHIVSESAALQAAPPEQLDLFTDQQEKAREQIALARERAVQQAVLTIKKRFGKNAILKGMNLEKGATARERNRQIGGHKA